MIRKICIFCLKLIDVFFQLIGSYSCSLYGCLSQTLKHALAFWKVYFPLQNAIWSGAGS